MKKILIIAFKDLNKGVRVKRQIKHLKGKYELHVVGYEAPSFSDIRFYQIKQDFKSMGLLQKSVTALQMILGCHEAAYKKLYGYDHFLHELKEINFDLIIAHDLFPLPLVYKIDSKPNILSNVHEYFFDQGKSSFAAGIISRLKQYLLNNYFLRHDHYFTVCDGIAKAYEEQTGKKFNVVTNAHEYVDLQPSVVNEKKVRIIHHGLANAARRIELMIEMMDHVDERYELDLILTTVNFGDSYVKHLTAMCCERPNVRIIPPVKPDEIVRFTNQYDIGLFLLPDTYFTHKHALPNKFFEFIQARLCVAIGPSIEMSKITKQYDLGIVASDFEPKSLATELNKLKKIDIEHYKNQCNMHAKELSSEPQMEKLESIIERTIG